MPGETRPSLPADVDVAAAAVSVGLAAVLGGYAAWIAADLLSRWIAFTPVFVVVGYLLFSQPSHRARAQSAGYVLAGLFAVTPLSMISPAVLAADRFGVGGLSLAFTTMNAVLFLAFGLVAGLVAYASYRAGEGD